MVSFVRIVSLAALMIGTVSVAHASGPKAPESDLAYSAIEAGNWTQAETQLRAELSATPDDPMRMVNLAYVLQRQGRDAEAAELYRQVLAMKSNPVVAVGPDERNIKGVRVKSIANKGIASIEGEKN